MPFYTSQFCASEIAMANGFTDRTWHWVNATVDNVRALDTADIVMSYLSWGFHYPVSVYAEAVRHLIRRGGRLIITVRRNTKGEAALKTFGFKCRRKDPRAAIDSKALLVCTV